MTFSKMRDAQTESGTLKRFGVLVQSGLLAGPFMTMIDSSIVNVALPDIARTLHSSLAAAQWVASAYLLTLAMALTATAYLSKRFGTRQVYLVSLVGFTISSGLCAVTPTLQYLIAARMAQGLFGAQLVPLAMNMLFAKNDTQKKVSAAAGMILFLAPAIGPSLGGLLLDWAGWPAIFLVNVPVGALAVIGAWRLPMSLSERETEKIPFDTLGFFLLGLGLAGITYGASQGPAAGWFASRAWPYWSAGGLLLTAYEFWAIHRGNPIVRLSLVRSLRQTLALVLTLLVAIVTFAVVFLVPAFMQEIQGKSAMVAGLALLPQGLITGIGTMLGNMAPSRWGLRRTVSLGMFLLTLTTVGLLTIKVISPAWVIAAVLSGRGFAIGLVIQPLLFGLIQSLPENEVADGNTFFNVTQRIGGTLGIALIATFFQSRESMRISRTLQHFNLPATGSDFGNQTTTLALPMSVRQAVANAATSGFHDAVWLVAAISAVGILMALFVGNLSIKGTSETGSSSGSDISTTSD